VTEAQMSHANKPRDAVWGCC